MYQDLTKFVRPLMHVVVGPMWDSFHPFLPRIAWLSRPDGYYREDAASNATKYIPSLGGIPCALDIRLLAIELLH